MSAMKILATYTGTATPAKIETVRGQIAEALGVECCDVIIVPGVTSVSVIDVPAALLKKTAVAPKAHHYEAPHYDEKK